MSQNILGAAATWLAGQLAQSVSVPVTYIRGALTCPLAATLGYSLLKVKSPGNAVAVHIVRTDADWIFQAATLILGGVTVLPVRMDVIQRLWPDGVTRQYQVLPYGADEPEYRFVDPERTMIRLHTKYIGQV